MHRCMRRPVLYRKLADLSRAKARVEQEIASIEKAMESQACPQTNSSNNQKPSEEETEPCLA